MRVLRSFAAATAATLVSIPFALLGTVPADGAGSKVLDLELNEARGATVARDTSGLHHNGSIGSHLVMNKSFGHWDRHSPAEHVFYGSRHLIVVPDASDHSLDPGRGKFSVEIRFRTSERFGNVIQKGQATTPGGQVKFQIPGGKLTCMFKTSSGVATAGTRELRLNDNRWHVVRCDRTPSSVTMYVDGERVSRTNHATGNLDNTKPWAIGGKLDCGPTSGADSCDYFAGDIDYVRLTKG
jgi:Laminin G domain